MAAAAAVPPPAMPDGSPLPVSAAASAPASPSSGHPASAAAAAVLAESLAGSSADLAGGGADLGVDGDQCGSCHEEASAASASPPAPAKPRGLPTAPFFPARGGRRLRAAAGGRQGCLAGPGGDAAAVRCRRLERELSDLQEAYARTLAKLELQCEARMREKDDEMRAWYRDQRSDIDRMKAGIVIMHAIFKNMFRRNHEEKLADRRGFEQRRGAFECDAAQLKAEHSEALHRADQKLQEEAAQFNRQLADERSQKERLQESLRQAENETSSGRAVVTALQEANGRLQSDCRVLNQKLDAKSEEIGRKQGQIEALEKEIRTLRSAGIGKEVTKAKAECDALKREIMGYVEFIVKILPDDDDPRAEASSQSAPRGVQEHLAGRAAAGGQPQSSARGPASPPRGAGALPPVAGPVGLASASASYGVTRGAVKFAGTGPRPSARGARW